MRKNPSWTLPLLSGLCLTAVAVVGVACVSSRTSKVERTYPKVDGPTMAETTPADLPGLHNVVAYHTDYWSGGVPEGDAGFDSLAGMGVKTIISVDGASPDVEAARARGIRYIHLPIGYNGFDETRKIELARATRDALLDGPVYIHCHHGKHRSAGAAGAAVASLGWATPDEMVGRMKVSGTAAGYKGLYACTANAGVLSPQTIDAIDGNFPERARPTGFVKAMVEIDEATEHLKEIEKAGWTVPKEHPDLVPAAIAGQLADLLRISAETPKARSKSAEFIEMLRKNSAEAQVLEDLIVAGDKDTKKLSDQFKLVIATCKDCHVQWRD